MDEFLPLKYDIKLIGPKGQIATVAPADTCAQCSIIGSYFLEKLGYDKDKLKRIELATLTGNVMAYQCKVKVAAEGKETDLDMVMIDDGYHSDRLILGVDFLKSINFLPRYIRDFFHLYDLIKEFKHKCVLVLGSYAKDHIKVLYAIKEHLAKIGYEGILLADYEDIEEQSNEEKMNLLGHLSLFVICENTWPSGHINELNICSRNTIATVMLQEKGHKQGATGMQSSYHIDFPFMKRIFYNPADLESVVRKAVKAGEALVRKRTAKLNKEYAYRKKD